MTESVVRVAPQAPDDAATALRELATSHARVAIAGGGTHRAPAADVDAIVETSAMRRIVEYAPEDQTVTVECGITLAELGAALAAHGQRLVVEAAEPERATLGGAIAADVSGPRRLAYGSMKDLILGVTIVRVDGTLARAGGKVVKNVAGFDISKLMVGSHGTLALVAVATVRVHPLPEASRAFRASGLSAAGVWALVTTIRERRLDPAAIVAFGDAAGRYDVDVAIEGFATGVAAKVDAFAAIARDAGAVADERDPAALRDDDASARRGGSSRVRTATAPADFAAVSEAALLPFAHALDASRIVAYPALGVAFVAGAPRDAATATAAARTAREAIERRGGSLVVEASSPAGVPDLERWGTPPASFALMRTLKSRFDPAGRLGPGTFVGGM